MIVVLDTNVLVSGLLDEDSSSGIILQILAEEQIHAAYNNAMLVEYQDVLLRPKFSMITQKALRLLKSIQEKWQFIITPHLEIELPDPQDVPFLESALAIRADALITGNLRHFPAHPWQGIKVVNPREFLEQIYPFRA